MLQFPKHSLLAMRFIQRIEIIEKCIQITPLARMASPQDIVGPIMFLLGEDSAFMTGQTLWVNGGGFMP